MMNHSPGYQAGGSNQTAIEPLMTWVEPLLTVIIPLYHEAATIAETLDQVSRSPLSKQIIVGDDGSTDDSIRAVDRRMGGPGAACGVRLGCHSANLGKGAAIRTGLGYAEGQVVVVRDADQEYDPSGYPALVGPRVRGGAGSAGETRRGGSAVFGGTRDPTGLRRCSPRSRIAPGP
jgi:cellulose synthase/poly-beta-1,6-N-acetylglucosamine synthase-like glycosyltransferase